MAHVILYIIFLNLILYIGFTQQGYEVNEDELTPFIERHGFPEFRQFLEQQLVIFFGNKRYFKRIRVQRELSLSSRNM